MQHRNRHKRHHHRCRVLQVPSSAVYGATGVGCYRGQVLQVQGATGARQRVVWRHRAQLAAPVLLGNMSWVLLGETPSPHWAEPLDPLKV
jgi:hypothetical protein